MSKKKEVKKIQKQVKYLVDELNKLVQELSEENENQLSDVVPFGNKLLNIELRLSDIERRLTKLENGGGNPLTPFEPWNPNNPWSPKQPYPWDGQPIITD